MTNHGNEKWKPLDYGVHTINLQHGSSVCAKLNSPSVLNSGTKQSKTR